MHIYALNHPFQISSHAIRACCDLWSSCEWLEFEESFGFDPGSRLWNSLEGLVLKLLEGLGIWFACWFKGWNEIEIEEEGSYIVAAWWEGVAAHLSDDCCCAAGVRHKSPNETSAQVWIDSSHNESDNFGLMENYQGDETRFVRARVKVVVSGLKKVMFGTGLQVLGDGGLESFRMGIVCSCSTSSGPFPTMDDGGLGSSNVGVGLTIKEYNRIHLQFRRRRIPIRTIPTNCYSDVGC
ncbi:hypothetical protein Droror1_Dr00012477 [Drosera rotundifolia]